jgi:ribosome-binding protein aMBF1 (putative translation factor)
MIKNERQYAITKSQADKLAQVLECLRKRQAKDETVHPLLRKAEAEALQSQLADLRAELADYEALRCGQRTELALASWDDLPRALIQARIAAGLSQQDLAKTLKLKEQQIQRYEATDYASASLTRLRQVIRALGIRIRAAKLTLAGPR